MKSKVSVLGCGRVGRTIVRDLCTDDRLSVTAVDASAENLAAVAGTGAVKTSTCDLSDPSGLAQVIEEADVVVGALPSALGFMALRTVLECGKSYCDISFMPENALELDDLARSASVTAVVDCGVAPGLSNLCAGQAHHELDRTDRVAIYVGGLPRNRTYPFEYKAPFAPADVIEEYTRPSRVVEGGKVITKPALSERELIQFPQVGTLEAFVTDGLRSLATTIRSDQMVEKTLRYPGHAELMCVLREMGLFDQTPVDIHGTQVKPLDLTSKLLFDRWQLDEDEPEFTLLRVVVEGEKDGQRRRYTYELFDETDLTQGMSSMSRTTGFPCAIIARMLACGELQQPGVSAPEQLVAAHPELLARMTEELSKRGVDLKSHIENPTGH